VRPLVVVFLCALAIAPRAAGGSAADAPSAVEVQEARRSRLNGRHFTAEVEMEITLDGQREDRLLEVWRDDEGARRERIMARFLAPSDLKNFGLLFVENAGKPNDYFIHQPALARVRRVSESIVSQDIYGVDLEFLGFGVAQSVRSEAESMERSELDGRAVYKLTERALEPNQRFDERVSWIDAATFISLRTEHLRAGKPALIARVTKLETIQGIPTPTRCVFERPGVGEEVRMVVRKIDYEIPIPADFFSTLALMKH